MRTWKRNRKPISEDSRIKYLMLAIFILGLGIIGKMYKLQVLDYDYYAGLAQKQQQVQGTLEPKRGRIFIEDARGPKDKSELFPLATNKLFDLVYAKPNMISDPTKVAEGIYAIYNEPKVLADVDAFIANDPEMASSTEEFRKFKKEVEIKNQKEAIIKNYVGILSKKDDPYEPLIKKADEELVKKIKEANLEGIDFAPEEHRYYPEKNIGAQILGFVGYVGDKKSGRYGLEGYFDDILSGSSGSIKADRDARGGIIIMDDKDYIKPEDGSDVFLTINRSIQFEACNKLSDSVRRHGASGGSLVIIDPKTGAIIAMCSYPDYDPNSYQSTSDIKNYQNPAITDEYEPGSTFKSITMASALDMEKVKPETTYNDPGQVMIEGWNKPISNSDFSSVGGHGVTNMTRILEYSLNTGAIWVMEKMGAKDFTQYVKKFGFGEKTGIELDGENDGDIRNLTAKKIKPINAATASFGQGITVTPLQMIGSYAAIANGGTLMKPYIVREVVNPKGEKQATKPTEVRRVISPRAAAIVTGMLVSVVEDGHAKGAQLPGYYVAGKTGTAQVSGGAGRGYGANYIHSFVGFSPINNPRFVMLTKIDNPKDAMYAESTAVPLFNEVAKFVLDYYQIPQERNVEEQMKKKK